MLQPLFTFLLAGLLLTTYRPIAFPSSLAVAANPSAATIHRRVEEVRITFSVEDQAGPVNNLPLDAFTIYDDARLVPSFTGFGQDSELPLRVGLLLDRSDSVRKEFSAEQEATQRFLQDVLRPSRDSIFLLDFTHQLKFRRGAVGDPQSLATEVNALAPGGQTALYDAIYAAARFEVMTAPETEPVRRVIILLSDGEDNYSRHALEDAIAAAQEYDVSVYAITVHESRGDHPGDAVLTALAEATGGRAFVLHNLQPLGAVFNLIQEELRREYSVSFHPPSADRCGYHRLVIQPRDPRLRVHARQGYYTCKP